MKQPSVITGMRQPAQARDLIEQQERAAEAERSQAPRTPLKVAGTVYESASTHLRIQLTSGDYQVNRETGRVTQTPMLVAQFEEYEGLGRYVNNHKNPETRKLIDQLLQENPNFGVGRNFWLRDEQIRMAQEKALANSLKSLAGVPTEAIRAYFKEHPEVRELLRSDEAELVLPSPAGKTEDADAQ